LKNSIYRFILNCITLWFM